MKAINILLFKRLIKVGFSFFLLSILFNTGCVESRKIASKSGVQLWAENCQRCHNTPSPSSFSASQWETIGMHMQSRALLTENEKNKIIDFLQSSGR